MNCLDDTLNTWFEPIKFYLLQEFLDMIHIDLPCARWYYIDD